MLFARLVANLFFHIDHKLVFVGIVLSVICCAAFHLLLSASQCSCCDELSASILG